VATTSRTPISDRSNPNVGQPGRKMGASGRVFAVALLLLATPAFGQGSPPVAPPAVRAAPSPAAPAPPTGNWQTGVEPQPPGTPNTTVVPRTAPEQRGPQAAGSPVTLTAVLTDDGQRIDQGLVWRIYQDKPGPDGKNRLIATNRESNPTLRLPAGDYIVNVGFGRANLTRRIAVPAGGGAVSEQFVLNAGGLRLTARLASGEAVTAAAVTYDVYSDERDQFGNRAKLIGAVKPGLIVRLNSGIYHIVSTYGDANATVRADVTVEAGKLTEVTASHPAAKVIFKLVTRAGGEAIADTQWNIASLQGEPVKESVGALPTHFLAPGSYTVIARSGGRSFRRDFSIRAGDNVYVEIIAQ
jgi:hypothetical protein